MPLSIRENLRLAANSIQADAAHLLHMVDMRIEQGNGDWEESELEHYRTVAANLKHESANLESDVLRAITRYTVED